MAQIEILLHPRKTRGCFRKESLAELAGVKDITISLPVEIATTILSSHQQPPYEVVGNERVLGY
jgi:hypothetical protein